MLGISPQPLQSQLEAQQKVEQSEMKSEPNIVIHDKKKGCWNLDFLCCLMTLQKVQHHLFYATMQETMI